MEKNCASSWLFTKIEILRQRLIFKTQPVLKRDMAGSCKRSATSHRTMQCHIQLDICIFTAIRMSSLIQYCSRPGFGSCKRSPIEQTSSSTVHKRLGRNDSSSGIRRHQQHSLSSANIISPLTKIIRKMCNVLRHKNIYICNLTLLQYSKFLGSFANLESDHKIHHVRPSVRPYGTTRPPTLDEF